MSSRILNSCRRRAPPRRPFLAFAFCESKRVTQRRSPVWIMRCQRHRATGAPGPPAHPQDQGESLPTTPKCAGYEMTWRKRKRVSLCAKPNWPRRAMRSNRPRPGFRNRTPRKSSPRRAKPWEVELRARLAALTNDKATDLQKTHDSWRQGTEAVLAQAEQEWKAAEAERLAAAEARWKENSSRSLTQSRAEVDSLRGGNAELGQLREKIETLQASLRKSETDAAKARADAAATEERARKNTAQSRAEADSRGEPRGVGAASRGRSKRCRPPSGNPKAKWQRGPMLRPRKGERARTSPNREPRSMHFAATMQNWASFGSGSRR